MKQGESVRSGRRMAPGGKRFLAAFLCMAMALMLLPTVALAAASLNVSAGPVCLRDDGGTLQYSQNNGPWTDYTGTLTLAGGVTVTDNTTMIDVQSGAHSIIFNGVTITSEQPMHIAKGATVDLQLAPGSINTLTATGPGKAALNVPADINWDDGTMGAHATLRIGGSGSLTAYGSTAYYNGNTPYKYGAGIGGNGIRPAEGCGVITINGGTIGAYGGGPGSADLGNTVATGAGIGSGGSDTSNMGGRVNSCTFGGEITIKNGYVTAAGGVIIHDGGQQIVASGAGIGNGGVAVESQLFDCKYTIRIEGGEVNATGGAAQIKNGSSSQHNAPGVASGSGIGGGGCLGNTLFTGDSGSILISGGTVNATGGASGAVDTSICARAFGGAGIGPSYPDVGSDAGSITITGGVITATGGEVRGNHLGSGAGIGTGGYHESHETVLLINISGGSITATGGSAVNTFADSGDSYRIGTGAGIGFGSGVGNRDRLSNIRISGGTIHATSPAPTDVAGQTDPNKKPKYRQGAGIGTGGAQNGSFGAPTFTISGGSIWAEGYTDAPRTPNGGSIGSGQNNQSCSSDAIANASGTRVYLTTLTLNGLGTGNAVTALAALLSGSAYGYGLRDVKTLDGKLYVYLPASTQTKSATAGAAAYYPKLTADDLSFVETGSTYGSFTAKTLYTGTPVTDATLAISPAPYRLSVSDVIPAGATAGYQWQRRAAGGSWTNIGGATGSAYTPGADDYGATLRVIVYGKDGYISYVVLDGGAAFDPPVITTDAALPGGIVGASYDQPLSATGATPVEWVLSDGALPGGLTVSSDGHIAGTPDAAGDYSFTMQAANRFGTATKRFTLTVVPAPAYGVRLTPSVEYAFPDAPLDYGAQTPKSVAVTNIGTRATGPLTLSLSGADAARFTLNTNALPDLAAGAGSTFTVTPVTGLGAGVYTANVVVTGANGIRETLALSFAVRIAPGVATTSLPDGTVNAVYSQTLSATGTAPITWSIASGSLPAGVTLNARTGELSGTPTAAGTFAFTVKAKNSVGEATKQLSITVAATPVPPTPTPTPTPAPGGSGFPMAGSGYAGNTYQGGVTANAQGALVCTVQADCKKLASVVVDGVQLTKDKDYTVQCGSTIVTLTQSYLATLKDGAHTLRVQFTDGRYEGAFTTPFALSAVTAVTAVPATGEPAGGALAWAALLLLAGLGLAVKRRA